MRAGPIGKTLSLAATMLCAIAIHSGCNSTPSLPTSLSHDKKPNAGSDVAGPNNPVVRPGMELTWVLSTQKDQPGLMHSGAGLVGPDGTMTIGPYGDCKIAGLTLTQAAVQMEKQLAAHLKQPHITLVPVPAKAETGGIVWHKGQRDPAFTQTQNSWTPAGGDGLFRPVGFQTLAAPLPGGNDLPKVTMQEQGLPLATPTAPPQPGPVIGAGGHFGHGPPMPAAPPAGPSEMSPIVLPSYVIRPPDVLLIESQKGLLTQPIRGQHLVRPDGTVGVGIYGAVLVAGKTLAQAREDIAKTIHARLDQTKIKLEDVMDGMSVDVLAYNSTVYYIITDGAGLGEQVYRFPIMGSETVLDAISNINGLPAVASTKRIWLARRNTGADAPYSIYPVDWKGITQQAVMATNWQVMPGDRIYVQADPMRRFNNNFSKMIEPIERLLGVTLLGSQAVNSIVGGPQAGVFR